MVPAGAGPVREAPTLPDVASADAYQEGMLVSDQDKFEEPGADRLDAATQAADAVDARQPADGGPEPTAEEEQAAERAAPADENVAESYKEQIERSADLDGEGAIDVANDRRA